MPGKVEVPMSWFPLMPKWCFFTYDSGAGAYWGAGDGMKFGRLLAFHLIGEKK